MFQTQQNMTNLWQIVSGFDICAAATYPGLNLFVIHAIGMDDIFASLPSACFVGFGGHALSANETPIMLEAHYTAPYLVTVVTTKFEFSSPSGI